MEKLFRKPLSDRTKAEMIAGRLRVSAAVEGMSAGKDFRDYAQYLADMFPPDSGMTVHLELRIEEGKPVTVNVTFEGKGGKTTVTEQGDTFPSKEFITKLILLGADPLR